VGERAAVVDPIALLRRARHLVRRHAHQVQEVEVHAVRIVRVRPMREYPGELRVDVERHVREDGVVEVVVQL
jgi:hypothetical protein